MPTAEALEEAGATFIISNSNQDSISYNLFYPEDPTPPDEVGGIKIQDIQPQLVGSDRDAFENHMESSQNDGMK